MKKMISSFFGNAPVRLELISMSVSSLSYGVGILLLGDSDRGLVTAFLYASYLVVGLCFLGANTYIAYWARGPYFDRLVIASQAARPGFFTGLVLIALSGLMVISGSEALLRFADYLALFGLFVALRTLYESLFAAKTSSEPRPSYWQHFAYFGTFLSLLGLVLLTGELTVKTFVICYVIASLSFVFAPWIKKSPSKSELSWWSQSRKVDRKNSRELFIGSYFSTMHLKISGLLIAAFHGSTYLGKYLVLWLAFEISEQLYKLLLMTKIHSIAKKASAEKQFDQKQRIILILRIGTPTLGVITMVVILLAPIFTDMEMRDVVAPALLLAANYLARLFLSLRLNLLRASSQIAFASRVTVFDAFLAAILVSVLPFGFGFVGVAIGLAISTGASLLLSYRSVNLLD